VTVSLFFFSSSTFIFVSILFPVQNQFKTGQNEITSKFQFRPNNTWSVIHNVLKVALCTANGWLPLGHPQAPGWVSGQRRRRNHGQEKQPQETEGAASGAGRTGGGAGEEAGSQNQEGA
jgi:hypothetical protein